MNKLASKFVFSFVLVGMCLAASLDGSQVSAQYYGQGETKLNIIIDKKLRPITDASFYDNIGFDQKVFAEGDVIEFKIRIENTGSERLTNVKFTDVMPRYLSLLFYPGVYNKTKNSIEMDVGVLEIGQSKEYLIRAKLTSLPTTSISGRKLQQVNRAVVVADKVSDSDEARYFVSATSVPVTGPNDIVIRTVGVLGLAMVSLGLRKVSRGY